MDEKPTYGELEQRIALLENEIHLQNKTKLQSEDTEPIYRLMLENISDTVILTDDLGNMVYVCPNTTNIFGFSLKDIYAQQTIQKFMNGSVCDITEIKRRGEIENIERSIKNSSGDVRHLLINVKSVNINGGTTLYVMHDITDRRVVEEDLEKYKNIVSSTTDCIAFLDRNYRYIIVNDAYEKFSSVDRKNFIGKTVSEYLSEDIFKKYIKDYFDRALRGEVVNYQEWFEYPILGKRFVDITYSPYRGNDNQILGIIAKTKDITEHKKLTTELQQSEEKFRALFVNARSGVFIYDPKTMIISDVNPAMTNIYGYSQKELLGKNCLELSAEIEESIKSASEANKYGKCHVKLRSHKKKDGAVFPVEVDIHSIVLDKKSMAFTIIRDISERINAENKQTVLQKQLKALWKISQMIDCDMKEICDTIPIELTKLTGSKYGFFGLLNETKDSMSIYSWSKDAMKDCNVNDMPLEFSIEKSGIWGKVIREKKPFLLNDYQQDCPYKKGLPEGHVSLSRVLSVPIVVSGQVVAVGAVANKSKHYTQDNVSVLQTFLSNIQLIIEKKKDQVALQKAHDELESRVEIRTHELKMTYAQLLHAEKLSSIGRLSASIAHEFNNPLQGVMSIVQGIKKYTDLDDVDAALVDLAMMECCRMRDLIRNLQDFNRPTSRRKAPMDIHAALESIILLGRKEYATRKISIDKKFAENLPQVMAVADQLKQVFLNLLNNASDACVQGGNITIATNSCKDNVTISVHDTGCGIAHDDREHIFEPFFTTKAAIKGTGLGLPVSYGIIKSHGGNITVDSAPGKGTTFSVVLPIKGDSDEEKENFTG